MRIDPRHFCASLAQVELPPHGLCLRIPVRTDRIKFALQSLFIGDPLLEDRTDQDCELQFGDVQPLPMLGRVPDLDFLGQSACLFWRECGVKRPLGMRVQVVAYQRDLLGFGEHPVEFFAYCRKICFSTMLL